MSAPVMRKQQAPIDPKKGAWYLSLAASIAYLVIAAYDVARGEFTQASKDLGAAAGIGILPASWFKGWTFGFDPKLDGK